MTIWVDCDGVLANFATAYLTILAEVSGRWHSWDEVTSFDFTQCVSSEAEDELVWRAVDSRPGLVRSLRWMPGAHVGLSELREVGQVRCLTAPHIGPHWMYERAQWLMNRGFRKKEIVFCSDKPLVPGDVLVEDNLATADRWQDAHPNGTAVLLDAPYNQGPTNARRARNWSHVVEIVKAAVYERNRVDAIGPVYP
jgi:5'(3')-deoxyribonucleotidase